MSRPVYVQQLVDELKNPDGRERENAARKLYKLGERAASAVHALISAFVDSNKSVVKLAGYALQEIGVNAVPALIRALRSKNPAVREQAAYTIGAIGEAACKAAPTLVHALADKNARVRETAAFALGEMHEKAREAIPALIRLTKDRSSRVRGEAVFALGGIGPPAAEATPEVMKALKRRGWRERGQAIQTLGKLGKPEALPAVIDALADERSEVRESAAEVLGKTGAKALPLIIAAVRQHRLSREEAQLAISRIQGALRSQVHRGVRKKPGKPVARVVARTVA